MRQNNNISNTPLVTSRQPSISSRKYPYRLTHNQPIDFNVRDKAKPSSYIIFTNNSSKSVLITDPNNNKDIVQTNYNNGTTKKKRIQFVLTKISNKIFKTAKNKMIEVRIKIQVVKKFIFLMRCIHPALLKNNSRKLRMKVH